jgi:long-chain acyl-CoA synthetase
MLGDLHVLDENMQPCPKGSSGALWFKTATPFEYFNDPARATEVRSPDGSMSTVGDVGYVDDDGFLYLTDRATFMIVSGGINIYPQEKTCSLRIPRSPRQPCSACRTKI